MKKAIHTPNLNDLPFEQILIRHFTTEVQLRSEFVFFFLLEGSMQISIYEKAIALNKHDIIFIKPYEVHSVPTTSHDIHVLALFIHANYLKAYCPDMSQIYFEKHKINYSESDRTYAGICTSLADIITNTIKTDYASRLKLLTATSQILIQLMDAFGLRKLDPQSNDDYAQQRISLLLDYLNANFAEKITLSSAADVLGFHPQYFSAFFKKHFHTTFIDYLTTLRVNKTLHILANTNQKITEIALNHGFSNHKTYDAAFRKIHGITPSTYRKEQTLLNQNSILENQNLDYFSFFQKYWQSDNHFNGNDRTFQNHMTLSFASVNKTANFVPNTQERCFSIGRASAILRSDIQQQIRDAKTELNIRTLRIRDIFSDDLFVYYEDEEKRPLINWNYIDIIFDFLLTLDIMPFPEIGFTPRMLASKKQYAGWIYRPNVSLPKSLKKWAILVESFMAHLISRYGKDKVIRWKFDFWTAPNLKIKDGYWNESQLDFFLFYRITYHSIKNIDPDIQLGSPNFSIPSGFSWYQDFFNYCREYELRPSYISCHLYNWDDIIPPYTENLSRFSDTWDTIDASRISKDALLHNLSTLQTILSEYEMDTLDLVVSDWNLSYIPRDLVRDICFMAPYILYTSIQTISQINTLCFRSLSDINEDFFIDRKPFHGGPGLMDFNGLKKASYYAFTLLAKMGTDIIKAGDNYLLTRSSKGFQLLLFYFVPYDSLYTIDDHSNLSYKQRYNIFESSEELVIHSILPLPEGSYHVKETRIDRTCGSAYDLWLDTGAPEEMEPALITHIQKRGCPNIRYWAQECHGSLLLDTILPPHGVVLLEIRTQR